MQLRPYQREAVNAVYQHLQERDDNPCVVLPTGCHAKDHPILMYDGVIKKVQDVRVGERIMGDDSTPRNVLALCHGKECMFRIVPHRGESFVVNEGHILSLVSTNEGKGQCPNQQQGGEITNISVRDYLKKSRTWRHLRKLYRVPVDFDCRADLPIPPYILGLLLGDGCIIDGVSLTSADDELGDVFIQYAESVGCTVRVSENDHNVPSYHLIREAGTSNPVLEALTALGLRGHRSDSKFIPPMYLTASRELRLQLLAGLCDTDGYICCGGVEYVSLSRELASDVSFLARSLGFRVALVEKYSSCQTGAGNWYYRMHISGDISVIPFRRNRHKTESQPRRQKKNVLRTGFTVEPLGVDDFYGFCLDGNHLYIDGNFFVHHNTGKSLVLGQIAMDAATLWGGRVLILAHVKELLEQNAAKLKALCPELNVGIHSAGLGQRDRDNPVLVAGIQSVYQRAGELGPFDLIIIDEAHLLPPDGEGMYRTFIADALAINPALRIIGLTATPFRLKGGVICKPENLLNAVCYEAGLKEMIAQGYLSPLRARGGAVKADLDSISIRGGEFVAGEAESVMNSGYLVRAACEEIVELTADRNSVLIFCTGVTHCQHVAKEIRRISGQECGVVTGDTSPEDRAEILARFKGEVVPSGLFEKKPPLKYLANVNVLTTGFDATNTDCVALLRPTNSPGLLVQMVGRGTRLHPGKQDCLILDYGGNILRHGPVDAIQVRDESDGIATVPAKECPECHALIHLGYTVCPECGYAFPNEDAKDKHDSTAADLPVLTGQTVDTEYPVMSVRYMVHQKRGADPDAPRSMRVEYRIGWQLYLSEWVCFEHSGFALRKAKEWWMRRTNMPVPETAYDAVELANAGALCETKSIKVRRVAGEKYDRIIAYELGPRPEGVAVPVAQDDFSDFDGGPFMQLDDSDIIPF